LEEKLANEQGILTPIVYQYKVYLFERILLCCKEMNPNKQKNKLMGKDKPTKLRLQLKGRIFMQNVTEIISIQKPGKRDLHLSIGVLDHTVSASILTDYL